MLASDASPAISAAAKNRCVAAAKGAVHYKYEYTPLRNLLKKDLDPATCKMLHDLSEVLDSQGRSSVIEKKTLFQFVQGDQLAENIFMLIASKQRRLQLKGAQRVSIRASVDALASAWLLREPGFIRVCNAMKAYRVWMASSGSVRPSDAFKDEAIRSWLPQLA